jgi:hypothetical protein
MVDIIPAQFFVMLLCFISFSTSYVHVGQSMEERFITEKTKNWVKIIPNPELNCIS